jgi:DNA-binding transcriptional ArsR family regulator
MESNSKPFTPVASYLIEDMDELRAITNQLRFDILECLIAGEMTVKEIGAALGVEPNNLYYHIRELERVGLIRVVRQDVVAGIIQKHYRAIAHYFRLSPALLHPDKSSANEGTGVQFVTGAVEHSLSRLRKSLSSGIPEHLTDLLTVTRRVNRMPPEKAIEFVRRLKELEAEFDSVEADSDELRVELQFAFFPHVERQT